MTEVMMLRCRALNTENETAIHRCFSFFINISVGEEDLNQNRDYQSKLNNLCLNMNNNECLRGNTEISSDS